MTTYTKTITSDAYIRGVVAINSDAYIKELATENTITSDSYIKVINTETINSNSNVKRTYGGSPLSTAYSSLVSLYRMNEPNWAGVPGEVADEKGSNSGAAMGDATTTGGLFSNAGIFTGDDTGVNCGSGSTFYTDEASVNAWIYPTAATNSYNDIVNSGRYRIILRSTKYIEFWAYSVETGWIQAVSDSAISLNEWTQITCTYDGTAKLYINGTLQTNTGTGGGALAWSGNTIYIGQSGGNTNEYTGKIDDTGFWSAALTQAEITNIWKQYTFMFTDSYIKKIAEETITSDSYIKVLANTNTITTDSYITVIDNTETINSNARIARIGVTKTLTSDAWVGEIETETINSNSYIKQDYTKTLNSNSIIKKPGSEASISLDSYIKKLDAEETIASDSYISKIQSNTLNSDSYILKTSTKTLASDSYIKKLETENTVNSDSYIKKIHNETTLNSDSYLKKIDNEETLDSDSYITKTYSNTLTSDSYIKKIHNETTINSDSYLKKLANEETIASDSYIKKLSNTKTITSDYIIKILAEEGSINSNAQIKKLAIENTLTSDGIIQLGGSNTIDSNYVLMEYGAWSEEWEVEIVIPVSKTINSNSYIKVLDNENSINSNAYIKRPAYEGALISNSKIKQTYTSVLNSNYYIRRTDTTKPYVYTTEYINKPVIISANTLSYTDTMI